MGNKRNRRSRRLESPSLDRGLDGTQIETSYQSHDTLTNVNLRGADNIRPQLIEPSQISKEIQARTEHFEQKKKNRIMEMEEMENKLDAILKEMKSSKSASTVTNPRSEINHS